MGTAVALETLKMVSETDFGANVMEKGAHFLEGLKDLQSRHAIVGDVDGLGLALRMEICGPDGFTPDKATLDWMADEGMKGDLVVDGRKYGLVLDVGGYHKNVITLAPNLMISREEIELAISLLDQLLTRAERR
jgi:4-aminobutyrate aminotransferase-like enzyme